MTWKKLYEVHKFEKWRVRQGRCVIPQPILQRRHLNWAVRAKHGVHQKCSCTVNKPEDMAAAASEEPELLNSLVKTQHRPEVLLQTQSAWRHSGLTPRGLMENQKLMRLEYKMLLPDIWRMLFQETPPCYHPNHKFSLPRWPHNKDTHRKRLNHTQKRVPIFVGHNF